MSNSDPGELPVMTPTILGEPSEFFEETVNINDVTNDYFLKILPEAEASVELLQIPDAMQIALESVELELPNWPIDWWYGFSPNGEWFVKENARRNGESFHLVSTLDPNTLIIEKTNSDVEEYLVIYRGGEWASDSSAFFASGTDELAAGCPYTYIRIYQIQSNEMSSIKFEGDELGYCLLATWSPDGEQLAVTSNEPNVIYIINKNAEIQQVIKLDNPDYYINQISWSESGLLLKGHYINDDLPKNELHLIKLKEPVQQKMLFSSDNGTFRIIDVDSNSSHILIGSRKYDDPTAVQLSEYDLEAEEIINQISIEADSIAGTRGNAPISTFFVGKDDSVYLYAYDWHTSETNYLGNYSFVINWVDHLHGYLVIVREDEDSYHLAIAKPQLFD